MAKTKKEQIDLDIKFYSSDYENGIKKPKSIKAIDKKIIEKIKKLKK